LDDGELRVITGRGATVFHYALLWCCMWESGARPNPMQARASAPALALVQGVVDSLYATGYLDTRRIFRETLAHKNLRRGESKLKD